jgi:hypothetical protein
MSSVFGFPLALVLVAAGLLAFLAASVIHWVLLLLAVGLVALGIFVLLTGGLPAGLASL